MPSAVGVLYVEDDPMLRELLAGQLRGDKRVREVAAFGAPREALDALDGLDVDVALLDLSLGDGVPNGVELGIAIRGSRPDLPIVIFSQYRVPRVEDAVPPRHRAGWSFVQKGAGMQSGDVVEVLAGAAEGRVRVDLSASAQPASDVLMRLTPRQREAMALAAVGYDAVGISKRLHLAHVTVRRELSLAYRVLVPNPEPSTDLRTAAVLEYLRLSAAEDSA